MPHLFDLNLSQKEALVTPNLPSISPRITFRGFMLPKVAVAATGQVTFGTEYHELELDVSCGLLNEKGIVLKLSIPVLPTKSGKANQASNVKLKLDNTISYIAAVGGEAMLDYFQIQNMEVEILAEAGSMTPLPFYKGRIVKTPTEAEGYTIFDIRPTIWDLVGVPVVLEKRDGGDINPTYSVPATGIPSQTTDIFSGVEFFHGINLFDEFGRVRTSVENDSTDQILIRQVDFQSYTDPVSGNEFFPLLGEYKIKFTTGTDFFVTMPDNSKYSGDINTNFNEGFLSIPASAWDVVGTNPTSAEISFHCYYCVRGNPISIVKNLLAKAFDDSWGDAPTFFSDQVDWDKFDCLEKMYGGTTVYVSETNKDNEVFSPQSPEKPFRVKDFCQKILEHIGCQLTFNAEGKVTANSSWYRCEGEEIQKYESCHMSNGNTRKDSAHQVFGGSPKYDRVVYKYGLDDFTGDYAGTHVIADTTAGAGIGGQKFNSIEVSLDYFKIGIHDTTIGYLNCKAWDLIKTSDIRLKMNLLPNWGLPVMPGDKFEIETDCQPFLPYTRPDGEVMGKYWEVYSVSKTLGGICKVQAKMIAAPGNPAILCNDFILCQSTLS